MAGESPERCPDCAAALGRGRRYCVGCGARVGARSPQLAELVRRLGERGPDRKRAQDAAGATGRRHGLVALSEIRLPSVRISLLLLVAFLGFGVLLGAAGSAGVKATRAASAGRLKVVLPQTAMAGSPSGSAESEGGSPSAGGEPPEAEAAPAPASGEAPARGSAAPAPSAAQPAPSASAETEAQTGSPASGQGGVVAKLPAVRHVFVLTLSDQPYAAVFGPSSPAGYLSHALERRGALLVRYDAVAHEQLADGIALISGQGPTVETAANCPNYADIVPATRAGEQQVLGHGCVYPKAAQTLAGQLSSRRLTWRAYVEGVGGAAHGAGCTHPPLGQPDPTASPPASGEAYATFRDPFVYFHSVIDSPTCAARVVGLARLRADLSSVRRTPNFSYIVPDRCHDGNPAPCAPGAPAGLAPADAFLQTLVPQIMGSPAYKQGGLLVITVDEAPSSGEFADSSSCCGQPQFPNLAAPPGGIGPRGGGTVGALLLSPYVKGGTVNQEPYNHFSLLRTIEDLFALPHLGYAALPRVSSFEAALFSARR